MLQTLQGFEHIAAETEPLRNDSQLRDNIGVRRDWRSYDIVVGVTNAIE
jgi:hypothetical protein